MGDSHWYLMITEDEWDAFMDDVQQCLNGFQVPQQEQLETTQIVESTRAAIVSAPFQAQT